MSSTANTKSKLSCWQSKANKGVKRENNAPQSPTSTLNNKLRPEGGDSSPVYFPSTQECSEEIDVLWDWHSPQTSQRRRKQQKRLIPTQSPKFPTKRHPSNNHSENFERLRNELKALQEELAMPDDESCLCVSPQEFKESQNNNVVVETNVESQFNDFNDPFDDSIDEQLMMYTQQLEENLFKDSKVVSNNEEKKFDISDNWCDSVEVDNLFNKYTENSKNNTFDKTSSTTSIETQLKTTPKVPLQRARSESNCNKFEKNVVQTVSGRLEFCRTRSFELAGVSNGQSDLPLSKLEAIERKRLEALEKLKSKRKQETVVPNKCSPEEIERKRLEALAKLEAKRIQDIVERKRQEALKKLQMRKINASQVKSTLTTRL